jgi:hypothetical protein
LSSTRDITLKKIVDHILRFRILHIAYWLYAFFSDLHFLQQNRPDEKHALINYADALNGVVFAMASVYTCILFLFPKFFRREKFAAFWTYSALTIIIFSLLDVLCQMSYVHYFIPDHNSGGWSHHIITFVAHLFNNGGVTILAIILIMAQYYYLRDKRNKEIEKEKISSELEFLKAQMNPHFLFNALNSIYVLMKEDVSLSEKTLLKFSSLLRYQIYDCSSSRTSLSKEISFLNDYIDLEKLRKGNNLSTEVTQMENIPNLQIAPFILMPFVENAFKHVSHFNNMADEIKIHFAVSGGELQFSVVNSCQNMQGKEGTSPGIGLSNVRRRLELLYPAKHDLQINRSENIFSVSLKINLNEN